MEAVARAIVGKEIRPLLPEQGDHSHASGQGSHLFTGHQGIFQFQFNA